MFVCNGFLEGNGCAVTIYDPPWQVPTICAFKTDKFGDGVRMVRYSHIQTLNQVTELRIGLQKIEEQMIAQQRAEDEAARKAKRKSDAPTAQGQVPSARSEPGSGG